MNSNKQFLGVSFDHLTIIIAYLTVIVETIDEYFM